MLWTVLLGFGTGRERTLAGLRRTCERVTGKSLVPSSFYDRFSTELARMFRAVLRELMTKLAASETRYGGVLEGFRDVLVADATVVKLHRLLARRFPGTRKNSSPAAAKLHLVMSASGTGAHKVKVTGERANDHRTLQMGLWVEGRLLLFDLGYFRYQLFDAIDRNGGYFITRLAANADPCIVGHAPSVARTFHRACGQAAQGGGRAVEARRPRRRSRDGVQASRVRRHPPHRSASSAPCRGPAPSRAANIGIYLTNIDPDSLDAHAVAQTYAARWQIELIFKELKSHYRLEELPTQQSAYRRDPCCSEPSSRCSSVAGCSLPCRNDCDARRTRCLNSAGLAIFAAAAPAILDIVLLPPRVSKVIARRLESMLLHEAPDPNRSRATASSNASNVVPHGHDSMQFQRVKPITDAVPRSPAKSPTVMGLIGGPNAIVPPPPPTPDPSALGKHLALPPPRTSGPGTAPCRSG